MERGLAKRRGLVERVVSDKSWTGILFEEAVKRMFLSWGWVEGREFTVTSERGKVDEYDFVVGRYKVDAKATNTKRFPERYYNCVVNADQADFGNMDVLILGHYVMLERCALVEGWMFRKDFVKKARRVDKGGEVPPKMVAETDCYLMISSGLTPPMELDRYR